MSSRKRYRITKSDYCRSLLTDTLPFETPIIFANDGIYSLLKDPTSVGPLLSQLLEKLVLNDPVSPNWSLPLVYKIRKGPEDFRRLSLPHPRAQWKMKQFYQEYEELILYFCSKSMASIRAPKKITGSFFFKSSIQNLNQYKTGAVSLLSNDELTKHSPSYFSYRGFDRLYKFFSSKEFFNLEKQFSWSRTLDVSKCFDSIYTHSISWAVKDKEFSKAHLKIKSTFGSKFDALMQFANHGETNGILIGPEISRVFAEILLQKVDCEVINSLSTLQSDGKPLEFGKDYAVRRYVDDVFIFSNERGVADIVYERYADKLLSINLQTNSTKSVLQKRPFASTKSRVIYESSQLLNDFVDKFLKLSNDLACIEPQKISSRWKLTQSFIEGVKSICTSNQMTYDDVGSFLISALTERIKKLVAVQTIEFYSHARPYYCDAILVLLDALFFLYKAAPSVNASYKLGSSIILLIRFTRAHLAEEEPTICQRIYELSESLLSEISKDHRKGVERFVHLESLNVALAIGELGPNYLLREGLVESIFLPSEQGSYFSIISCLFYIRDDPSFTSTMTEVVKRADTLLSNLDDIQQSAEKTYLLLDLLTCPYISKDNRKKWLRASLKAVGISTPSNLQTNEFFATLVDDIHVNWSGIDLLSALEKKELKPAY